MSHLTQPVLLTIVICTCVLLLAVVLLGRKLSLKIGAVHAEFSPNGGSSAKDQLNRIEVTVSDHTVRLAKLEKKRDTA